MPYKLSDLPSVEAPATVDVGELGGGTVHHDLPSKLQNRLDMPGLGPYKDASREDAYCLCALLGHGLSPEDAYATFSASPRGEDARDRKSAHFEDYMARSIKAAMAYTGQEKKPSRTGKDGEVIVEHTHRMEAVQRKWFWQNYIPSGRITIIAGDPGEGKSSVTVDLIASASKGEDLARMAGSKAQRAGRYAIITAEEDTAEDILPKLEIAKANMIKVKVIRQVKIDGQEQFLKIPRDLELIRKFIETYGVVLLAIDPLNAFLEKDYNSYKDQDIRSALAPLEAIAEDTHCAILIVCHLTKKEETSALYRVSGSIGLVGAARSVLGVKAINAEKYERVLYSLKANLSRRAPALKFRTRGASYLNKLGEKISTVKIEWLGVTDSPDKVQMGEGPQGLKNVYEFLVSAFGDDPEVPAKEIKKAADDLGLSWATLRDHKYKFGVQHRKDRDGSWLWCKPKVDGKTITFHKAFERWKAVNK